MYDEMFISASKERFVPCLLKVDVSANHLSPSDTLWVTACWQNRGDRPAERPLHCFMEMEFGYQRIPETQERHHRIIWEPQPGLHYWRASEMMSTTCRWRVPSIWGGTYRLFLGFCDMENLPFEILGEDGRPATRVYIGDIELGWGWGAAVIELTRKAWSREFNRPVEATELGVGSVKPLEIGDEVKVQFDPALPVIRGMEDRTAKFSFEPLDPEIVIRDFATDRLIYSYEPDVSVSYTPVVFPPAAVAYRGLVNKSGSVIASFCLRYEVSGRRIGLTLLEAEETNGYELLEIGLPSLFAMAGDDVHLVDFYGGGRLVPLAQTRPMGYVHAYETRNAAAVYNEKVMAALESHHLDDRLCVTVQQTPTGKRALIGTVIVNRVRGRGKTVSIATPASHRIELDMLGPEWGPPSWLSWAKYLRQGLQGINRDFYRRAFNYLYYAAQGPRPEPWQVKEDSPFAITRLTQGLRFPEILDQVKKYHRILDGYRQIAFIYGYNKQNDDDGTPLSFPYAYETDPRAGTIEELKACLAEAADCNAFLGLYENYDDIYLSRHADLAQAALDEYGQPFRGWIWADGMSYITGFRKYVQKGQMQERVRRMMEIYGSRRTGYLDVLSSEVRRYDFDPEYPASAETSLPFKAAVIEEYHKYGVDITSEVMVHPYIGRIGYAAHASTDWHDRLFAGESYIPLLAAVYHGVIAYNGCGGSRTETLKGLVDAVNYSFEVSKPYEECVPWIYLQNMPLGILYDEKMEDYREEGGVYRIAYSGRSSIMVDFNRYAYEIIHHGRIIARDWTTFVPGVKEDTYLAFSLYGGLMSYPAPEGWTEGVELRAVILTMDGEGEELDCRVGDGEFAIDMPAGKPVRVALR